MQDDYLKPLPEPSIDSQPFWDGLKERRILLQKCSDCGTIRHYPRPMCDKCHSTECEWVEASGKGTLYSWTETHHPFHFGFKAEVPYILATVTLDEGVRMQTKLGQVAGCHAFKPLRSPVRSPGRPHRCC